MQSFELSSSSVNCQNSWMQSIFKKYFPHDIFAIISSHVGSLKCSLLIALFKFRGSKHTCFARFRIPVCATLTSVRINHTHSDIS